eukprot:435806_1
MTNWIMNDHTLNLISRCSDEKHKNLQIVVRGPTIKCDLPNNNSIIFQPHLTTNEMSFDVEMKFISTWKGLPIKVHFDVVCKHKDLTYYASLHPRIMDIKWNNKFHVALPPMEFSNSEQKTFDKLKSCYHCCEREKEQKK